jgi:MFS family permease
MKTLPVETELKKEARLQNGGAFLLCMLCYLFGGTVSTLVSVYLPVAVPELLGKPVSEQELGDTGAYLNSAFIFGWVLGGLLLGVLSDKIGRVKTLAFSAGLYGLFTLLVVWAGNWQTLLVYRFLAGMGVGGVLLISTVYISEIWQAGSRPVALGMLAVSFPVGIVLAGSLNMLFAHWREAFWLGILPLILAGLTLFFLPESRKWQQLKKSDNLQDDALPPGYGKNLLTGSVIFGAVLVGLWAIFSWLPTWVQSLLHGISDGQNERGITMMLLGTGGMVGGSFSGFLVQKLGNRRTLLLTFSGCLGACCLLFLTNSRFSSFVYAETAFLALFFGVSQGALSNYIPALFPTAVRATATGFCFNIGRFFTGIAVFFVGSLVVFFGGFGKALLAFSAAFLIAFLMAFFTKDKTENTEF